MKPSTQYPNWWILERDDVMKRGDSMVVPGYTTPDKPSDIVNGYAGQPASMARANGYAVYRKAAGPRPYVPHAVHGKPLPLP